MSPLSTVKQVLNTVTLRIYTILIYSFNFYFW
jgi:hypothetical protein